MSIIRPSMMLDFARTGAMDPRGVFTRTGSGLLRRPDGAWIEAPTGAPRFDHADRSLGLLVEWQRTNLVRNPRGEGVAVGSAVAVGSSTIATNWGIRAGANYTVNVLGSGVEDGVPYVDVEYIGTDAHEVEIGFESLNAITLTSSGVYAAGLFVRVLSGSWTNIGTASLRVRVDTPSSSNHSAASVLTATGASLKAQRFTGAATVASGATNGRLQLVLSGNGSASITLRLGLPTCELGAWASSPILPPAGTPGATTRGADQLLYTLADYGIPSSGTASGTVVVAGRAATGFEGGAQNLAVFDDGTTDNRVRIYRPVSRALRAGSKSTGIDEVTASTANTIADGADFVAAMTYSPTGIAVSLNGGSVVSAVTTAAPAMTRLNLSSWGGTLARLAFIPQRVSDAVLQSLSA